MPNSTTPRLNAGVMAALRTWTDDLVAKANALLAIGSSPAVVAEEIGKTVKAVRRAIERRLIGATMEPRDCLKCRKRYTPRWAQNWLCEACGKTGGLSDAGAVASVSKFVRGLD